jgi:large subunit ribosomal protein L10
MKKLEKIEFAKKLTQTLQSASSYVLVDFSGMDVGVQNELKKRLKEVGAQLLVVKNTLLKRAGTETAPKEVLADSVLEGQTALIVTSGDPISPIQVLGKFIKEFELPKIKVGVVEEAFQDKEAIIKIGNLPSKEALAAQVLGVIVSPASGLVSTLEANLQKLVFILSQKAKGGD